MRCAFLLQVYYVCLCTRNPCFHWIDTLLKKAGWIFYWGNHVMLSKKYWNDFWIVWIAFGDDFMSHILQLDCSRGCIPSTHIHRSPPMLPFLWTPDMGKYIFLNYNSMIICPVISVCFSYVPGCELTLACHSFLCIQNAMTHDIVFTWFNFS